MTTTPSDTASVRGVHAAFADLVCADLELLRAEFDAIIDASWGDAAPPRPSGRAAGARGPVPQARGGPGSGTRRSPGGAGPPRRTAWMPRSPPC
jgi:hypothetical protein